MKFPIFAVLLTSITILQASCSRSPEANLARLLETRACSSCNLQGVDLSGKDLSDVDLSDAKLNQANLQNANLTDAALYSADLTGANVTGTNFSGANLSSVKVEGVDFRTANLVNVDFIGTSFEGTDLTGVNLSSANLSVTNLVNANLSNANLQGVDLSNANVEGALLNGADLTGASLDSIRGQYITDTATRLPDADATPRSDLEILHFLPVCKGETVVSAVEYEPAALTDQQVKVLPLVASNPGNPPHYQYKQYTNYFRAWNTLSAKEVSVVACIQEIPKAELIETCEYRETELYGLSLKSDGTSYDIDRYHSELKISLIVAKTGEEISQIFLEKDAEECSRSKMEYALENEPELYIQDFASTFETEIQTWAKPHLGEPKK